jgi:hypothetical protein
MSSVVESSNHTNHHSTSPEVRRDRAVFTRKLEKICQALDTQCERDVVFKHFLLRKTLSCTVRVTNVSVVGSYSRGALTCGDLDLVLQLQTRGPIPRARTIAKSFFGVLPLVSYFHGTPDENDSGVPFPEAVRIWAGPGCDWRSDISGIKLNASAGPAPRESDCIPLRRKQLANSPEELNDLARQWNSASLEWEFVPFDKPVKAENVPPTVKGSQRGRLWNYEFLMGAKSRELLPAQDLLMKERGPFGEWSMPNFGVKNVMNCGGCMVLMGCPQVPVHLLIGNLCVHQLAVVPRFSSHGPNGAWLIRRGPKHEDVTAMGDTKAWYVFAPNQSPTIRIGSTDVDVLMLFRSREEAQATAALWNDGDGPRFEAKCATGLELLRLCAASSVINIEGTVLPTRPGEGYGYARRYTDVTLAELMEVLNWQAAAHRSSRRKLPRPQR